MTKIIEQTITNKNIAFQGVDGAYSHLACQQDYSNFTPIAYGSFMDAFHAVERGDVGIAMIPIENTLGSRVADIHLLLPESPLHIVEEFFLPINHCLMAKKGVKISELTHVHSHIQGLAQCRRKIKSLGLKPVSQADTAGSAKMLSDMDTHHAAIASSIAAEIYGLDILDPDFKDEPNNITRFIILSKDPIAYDHADGTPYITSLLLTTRDIPAVLYKCLGGLATEGINLLKLESYVPVGSTSARFYIEMDGHPHHENVARALEELNYYTKETRILGTYPRNVFRDNCASL